MSDVEQASVKAAIEKLLASNPKRVSFAQIDSAMKDVGLDPARDDQAYMMIEDALESLGIAIVFSLEDNSQLASEVEADLSKEIQSLLEGITDGLARDEKRLLTAEEEKYLLEIRHAGILAEEALEDALTDGRKQELRKHIVMGKQAENELLKRNVGLVAKWVFKFGSHAQHLDVEDLIQEGMIGLMTAIQRFDPETKYRLSTYATYWIRQAISRAIADKDRAIRFPVHVIEANNRYRKAVRSLRMSLENEPSDIEIAYEMGLLDPDTPRDMLQSDEISRAVGKVLKYRRLTTQRIDSLDDPIGDSEGSFLGEFVSSNLLPDPVEAAISQSLQDEIAAVLEGLNPKERQVIEYRFGLNGKERLTLQKIGDILGVTRERVRQIEEKALKRLRRPQASRNLANYLNLQGEENERYHSTAL